MADEIIYPDAQKWWIKTLRFGNVLDDSHNMISPTKLNLWSSIVGALLTATATAFSLFTGTLVGIEHLWAPAGTWLGHAFTAHHFDKKERNRASASVTALRLGIVPPEYKASFLPKL